MIIIADSGATKTDWRVIDKGIVIDELQTIGFNPYFVSSEEIKDALEKELFPFFDNKAVEKVFFYGAGCSCEQKGSIVSNALEDFFQNARIYIEHDLLGAARALCGKEKGIACILGTGSNSCLYDGTDVIENVPSLGYFFGDEGSGAHIGRIFIKAVLKNELPAEVKSTFDAKFGLSFEKILDTIYKKPMPSRFLASFAEFIGQNINQPYLQDIIRNCFRDFFDNQLTKYTGYKEVPVHFLGSIAFNFSSLLNEVSSEYGISLNKIVKSPIAGLVEYHKSDE